jgi:NAD(P)-dependent dehydrogenase (short-subunit alcohol dehydrogenase family)
MSSMDRTALVTGAAQGIGAAIATRFAVEGVKRLVLVDRDGAGLEATAGRLAHLGAKATPVVVDLIDIESACAAIRPTLDGLGGLNILANAAGLTDRGGLEDTDIATFDRLMGVNARAPFFLMQMAAPNLRRRQGVIVNICSMLAYGGPPFLLAYSASKAALVALTKGAANTLKRDRVRAFGVNLGWTVTPSEHRVQTERHRLPLDWAEAIGAKQPFGRLLVPEDVADLVAFLISPGARMMTGALIDLDQFVAGTVDDDPGAA